MHSGTVLSRISLNSLVPAVLVLFLGVFTSPLSAQDICRDLLAQGYYDESSTFTSLQSYRYIQHLICSDSTLTYQQASQRKFDSRGKLSQCNKWILECQRR